MNRPRKKIHALNEQNIKPRKFKTGKTILTVIVFHISKPRESRSSSTDKSVSANGCEQFEAAMLRFDTILYNDFFSRFFLTKFLFSLFLKILLF